MRYQNLSKDHNQNCKGKTEKAIQKPELARSELRTSVQHVRSLPLTSSFPQIVLSYLIHMRNKDYKTTRGEIVWKECDVGLHMCPEDNHTTPKL